MTLLLAHSTNDPSVNSINFLAVHIHVQWFLLMYMCTCTSATFHTNAQTWIDMVETTGLDLEVLSQASICSLFCMHMHGIK